MNKAFYMVLGKPLIVWTIEALSASPLISEIIPVFSADDMDTADHILSTLDFPKIQRKALGGKERQDSVFSALQLIDDKETSVVVHDGARPLVDTAMVSRCLQALDTFDGAVTAIPIKDTVKEALDGKILRTMDRASLFAIQTPQAFKYITLYNAYQQVIGKRKVFTDDAAVVEEAGGKLTLVDGSERNIKITTPDDILILELFLKDRYERTM